MAAMRGIVFRDFVFMKEQEGHMRSYRGFGFAAFIALCVGCTDHGATNNERTVRVDDADPHENLYEDSANGFDT